MHLNIDQRARINAIKEMIGISDLLPDITIKKTSYCPFCRKKKWYSPNNKSGKCLSSSCPSNILNKNYLDIIDIYRLLNGSPDYKYPLGFQSTLNLLESKAFTNGYKSYEELINFRDSILKAACASYMKALWGPSGVAALSYLRSRGFTDKFIKLNQIGYAPNNSYLRDEGFLTNDLEQVGLLTTFSYKDTTSTKEYFSNRIIFPIKDYNSNLVHLQGRWLGDVPKDEKGEDKWPRYKSSKGLGIPSIDSYVMLENKLEYYSLRGNRNIFICEGVPDTLSLSQGEDGKLSNPVIGIFGLYNLLKHISKINKFENIYLIGDNDKFSKDHPFYPNIFKSWRVLIPQAVDLQLLLPSSKVHIWMPPTQINNESIKDVNDLLCKAKLTNQEIRKLIEDNSEDIIDKLYSDIKKGESGDKEDSKEDNKGYSNTSKHEELLRLIAITQRKKDLINGLIPRDIDMIDYFLDVLRG